MSRGDHNLEMLREPAVFITYTASNLYRPVAPSELDIVASFKRRIQLTPNLLSHETEKAKPRHSRERCSFVMHKFPATAASYIHHIYLSLLASRSDSSKQRMSFSRTSQELVSRIPFIWQPSIRIFVPGPLTFRMMLLVVSSMNSTRTCVTPPREPVVCQNSYLYSLRLNCVVSRYWIREIVPRTSTSKNYWISSVFTSK
jgi:hypothetical protein